MRSAGWSPREAAALAERLLAETVTAQQVQAGQLTIHADRGTSMTSKPVALLLADLGVTRSHSRPHVPDDNPYSESQFKTLKHHPTFPDRFGSHRGRPRVLPRVLRLVQRRAPPRGIGLLTPADVHYGRPRQITSARAAVLEAAYAAHPERFVGKPPQPPAAGVVWINKPIDPGGASAISRLTCLTRG